MVGMQYEEIKLRQQNIEVKALMALCEWGNHVQKFEALKHLEAIAYPNKLAEKINKQQVIEVNNEKDMDELISILEGSD